MDLLEDDTVSFGSGASGFTFCPRLKFSPLPSITSVLAALIAASPPIASAAPLTTDISADVHPNIPRARTIREIANLTAFSPLVVLSVGISVRKIMHEPSVVSYPPIHD